MHPLSRHPHQDEAPVSDTLNHRPPSLSNPLHHHHHASTAQHCAARTSLTSTVPSVELSSLPSTHSSTRATLLSVAGWLCALAVELLYHLAPIGVLCVTRTYLLQSPFLGSGLRQPPKSPVLWYGIEYTVNFAIFACKN